MSFRELLGLLLSAVLALGQSLRHFLDNFTWWHFQSTSKEVIWLKIFLNYMHGLKSAILAIFHKGLGWPSPVSAALKNDVPLHKRSQIRAYCPNIYIYICMYTVPKDLKCLIVNFLCSSHSCPVDRMTPRWLPS